MCAFHFVHPPIHIFEILLSYLTLYHYYFYFRSPVHASFHTCTQRCTYIVLCMLAHNMHMHVFFFFSHIYIHALLPHVAGFSPAHLFLHTSAFSYMFAFVFSIRAFWHVNARKHTRACTSCLLCSHSSTCKLWHSHIHALACPHVSAMLAHVCTCAV